MTQRLTDRGIAALKPADKPYLVFDSEVSGLAIKIYETGRKAFVFDWRQDSRQRRVTIGKPPVWTIGRARIAAGKMRLKADTGESVAPARGMRLVDLIEQWRCSVKLTRRRNTFNSYSRLIDCHIVPQFGNVDPRGLTRNAVEAWHSRLAQRIPVDANRALAVLSVFLSWLVHDGRVERNVALGIKRKPESARHVLLDAAEIDRAHAALDVEPNRCAALALQLALLTGCRIGEALGLAPEQIDHSRKLWIKPAASTKQARLHITPLSDQALAIARQLLALDRPSYDACRRAWGRARARVGRVDVHIHDLRHSHASALARNGASLPQIGRLLGHTSAATTQRYLHLVDRDLVDLVERTR